MLSMSGFCQMKKDWLQRIGQGEAPSCSVVQQALPRPTSDYHMHDCYVTWGLKSVGLEFAKIKKQVQTGMGHMFAKLKCDSTSG